MKEAEDSSHLFQCENVHQTVVPISTLPTTANHSVSNTKESCRDKAKLMNDLQSNFLCVSGWEEQCKKISISTQTNRERLGECFTNKVVWARIDLATFASRGPCHYHSTIVTLKVKEAKETLVQEGYWLLQTKKKEKCSFCVICDYFWWI